MRALCIGECMVELRSSGANTYARNFAGDAYNTAVYLKRSLPELEVQFVTATGEEWMSRSMRESWRAEGIDGTWAFTVSAGVPGLYMIETDESGERRFQYWRSHSAARQWWSLLCRHGDSLLAGADLVFFSGISLAILSVSERAAALEWLGRLRGKVNHVAFDPNVRMALWESSQAAIATTVAGIGTASIVLPSADDAKVLCQSDVRLEQLGKFRQWGAGELAMTLGPEGCLISDHGSVTQLPVSEIHKTVDTSGAGDSFNGAYLAARLRGESAVEAARAGLTVSARVVTHSGAVVPTTISHPSTG